MRQAAAGERRAATRPGRSKPPAIVGEIEDVARGKLHRHAASGAAASRAPALWQGLLTLPLGRPKVSRRTRVPGDLRSGPVARSGDRATADAAAFARASPNTRIASFLKPLMSVRHGRRRSLEKNDASLARLGGGCVVSLSPLWGEGRGEGHAPARNPLGDGQRHACRSLALRERAEVRGTPQRETRWVTANGTPAAPSPSGRGPR